MKFAPAFKQFKSYRNIFTVAPSQHLFDDLVSPEHFATLQRHESSSSGIDHNVMKTSRPFQYGDTRLSLFVFDKLNWTYGRFSDGEGFGVWYGSLEEKTSQYESLYHLLRLARDQFANPKNKDDFIIFQRRMLLAACQGARFADLRKAVEFHSQLTANDYTFCHQIARQAKTENIDGFLTPSARWKGGACTPIFNPDTIRKDECLYYFDFIIYRSGPVELRRTEVAEVSLPNDWS